MEQYVAKVERIIGKYYSNETFSNVLVYINILHVLFIGTITAFIWKGHHL